MFSVLHAGHGKVDPSLLILDGSIDDPSGSERKLRDMVAFVRSAREAYLNNWMIHLLWLGCYILAAPFLSFTVFAKCSEVRK